MDSAPLPQNYGSSFQRFAAVETHRVVECVYVASASPIVGMVVRSWLHSLGPCNSDHYPYDSHLNEEYHNKNKKLNIFRIN